MDKKNNTIDFQALFLSSPVPRFVVQFTENGGVLCSAVNDKALSFFGHSLPDIAGEPLESLIDKANLKNLLMALQETRDRESSQKIKLTSPSSSEVLSFVVSPLMPVSGRVDTFDVAALPDSVTEDESVQRERNDAISLLTSVFDVSEVGIVVTDRHQRIVRINDSFVRIYGWHRDQVIGHEFSDLIIPEEREVARQRHAEFMESGIRSSGEIKMLRKDGSIANVLFTTAALELSHGRQFQVTTIMDITMRKKMEESLRIAKEHADAASKAKSSFLANMSHELRTPLNAIIGFSEMMTAETFGPVGSDKYKEYITDIHLSAEHLLEVINEVLDMSKIEAGRVELDEERMDVAGLIDSVVRMMASRAFTSSVTLKETVPEGMPTLYGDHRLLRQILINLVGNSVKFSDKDTVIEISGEMLDSGEMAIKVSDQGIGIPEDKIEEALEPFGQVKGSVRQVGYQGTGLGLPLAKAMVELHGGHLQVLSKEGEGTTVVLVFPASRVIKSAVLPNVGTKTADEKKR